VSRRARRWRAGLVLTLALATATGLAQERAAAPGAPEAEGLSPAKLEALETAIEAYRSEHGIPGLSLAIALDGKLVLANGYGLADLENRVPARDTTVYRLASLSKPITATAVMQLAERGDLDIDLPIQKYVPDFPIKAWRLTTRQLLSHMGGVRHYRGDEFESTRHYRSLRHSLEIFRADPLLFPPGRRFLYTSYGYTLLGCAVEKASGLAFDAYLRERVFSPAGMEGTRVDDVLDLIPNRAHGYRRTAGGELKNSSQVDTSSKVPGGGLCGTAPDIARFVMALQAGVLVRHDTLQEMLTARSTADGKSVGYGYGFNVSEQDGVREAWHSGGQPRVSNFVYFQPERRLVIALLSNLEEVPRRLDLARQLAGILRSAEPAGP
jgi:serine beta-lactamase-like protein LACTB